MFGYIANVGKCDQLRLKCLRRYLQREDIPYKRIDCRKWDVRFYCDEDQYKQILKLIG